MILKERFPKLTINVIFNIVIRFRSGATKLGFAP